MAATQIVERQIADGAITDAKVKAGAAIATNKLAGGADFILRTGSVAFTGNMAMGNNKITGLTTATANDEAVNLGQLNTAISGVNSAFAPKGTVRVATTANITLTGTQTIDTIAVAAGERVLVKNQTTQGENGIYVVAAGAWSRSEDMNTWAEVPGGIVTVQEGSQAETVWISSANQGGTLGTTAITFINPFAGLGAGMSNSNFVDKATPSGTVNGSNTAFTLASTPVANSEHVYLNGILLEAGAGNDYTISGSSITFLTAPLTGEKIRVSYRVA